MTETQTSSTSPYPNFYQLNEQYQSNLQNQTDTTDNPSSHPQYKDNLSSSPINMNDLNIQSDSSSPNNNYSEMQDVCLSSASEMLIPEYGLASILDYPSLQDLSNIPSPETDAGPLGSLESSVRTSAYLRTIMETEDYSEISRRGIHILKTRVCRTVAEADVLMKLGRMRIEKLLEIKKVATPVQLAAICDDFADYLVILKNTFEQVALPTIVWEDRGIIHYVNPSFRELTSYSKEVPTERTSFAFMYTISPAVSYHLAVLLNSCILDTTIDNVMVPCSFRDWGVTDEEQYITGTLCTSIKRDMFGIPMMYVGSFLPDPTTLENQSKPK